MEVERNINIAVERMHKKMYKMLKVRHTDTYSVNSRNQYAGFKMYGTDMCAQLQVPVRFGQDSGGRRILQILHRRTVATAFRRERRGVTNAAVSDRSPSDL